MQEETTQENKIKHYYYELDDQLLAKPNTLVNLLNSKDNKSAVFCNTPSDADLIDAIIKKNQLKSFKMIGHVPFTTINECKLGLENNEFNIVILTDISAQELDLGIFDNIINYSIHNDPEVYIHRFEGTDEENSKVGNVYSLVNSTDFSNFHYLKKILGYEIDKLDAPSNEEMLKLKASQIIKEATSFELPKENDYSEILEALKADDNFEAVVKNLLHNTLAIIPELKAKTFENNYKKGRNSDNKIKRDYQKNNRPPRIPTKKFTRFYLGHGEASGFNEDKFKEIAAEKTGINPELINCFKSRDKYSFADLPIELSNEFLTKMTDTKLEDGTEIYIKKATTVSIPLSDCKFVESKEPKDKDQAA